MIFRSTLATGLMVALLSSTAGAEPVTPERLLAAGTEAEAGNWLMIHKDYTSTRHSTLDQITMENVDDLQLAFAFPIGGLEKTLYGQGSLQTTPLVNDGMMYVTDAWGTPYKFDVSSGRKAVPLWIGDTGFERDPNSPFPPANRGAALWQNLVITNMQNGMVMAFDDATGEVVWENHAGTEPGEAFTGAPLVVGDKVIIGQAAGDFATRGWIAALDAGTGEELWRRYVVPEPGQPGSETWKCDEGPNEQCWKTGGGGAWVTGSFDPESNALIWGTGNPVPMFDPSSRPGDNLYTNSTVALDVDTGELKWHFQYTPNDYFDYDEVGSQLLLTREVDGQERKVVGHFGRNGYFYEIDRTDGTFLQASQYGKVVTWTDGINPETGKPVEYDASKDLQVYKAGALHNAGDAVTSCPHLHGGVNFFPTVFNPNTGMAYGAAMEGCSQDEVIPVAPEDIVPGSVYLGGTYGTTGGVLNGSVTAMEVGTGTRAAQAETEFPFWSGLLSTPDMVWAGDTEGTFAAYDAATLEEKWSINVGGVFAAPPITYTVDGKQYIAVAAGPTGLVGFFSGQPEHGLMQAAAMIYVFALKD